MPTALLDMRADAFMPWVKGSITPALPEKDRGKVGRMSIPRTRMPSRRRCSRALTKSESQNNIEISWNALSADRLSL